MSRRKKSCLATAPHNVFTFLRMHYGLTQGKLARECDLAVIDVSKCERKLFGIKFWKIQKIAAYFHVPLDAIIHDRFDLALRSLRGPAVIKASAKRAIRQKQLKRVDNGLRGEEFVLEHERKKLAGTLYENAVDPHYSLDPSFGFDLLSFTTKGELLYIEVKTTSEDADEPFYMSANEKGFAEHCRDEGLQYELHRVYHVNGIPQQIIYSLDDLLRFRYTPNDYIVTKEKYHNERY